MGELTVLSPQRLIAGAVGGAVVVTGSGKRDVDEATANLRTSLTPGAPVAVAGTALALDAALRPGQLVVASELRTTDGAPDRPLPSATLLAAELRRSGLDVQIGPVVSSPTPVGPARRAELAGSGALVVDTESAWVAAALADHPLAVVRSVAGPAVHQSAGHGAADGTQATLADHRAVGSLLRVRPPLERWAAAVGYRRVLLASPRSFCAGVDRAIEIVERALERFGQPVYVRRQIVHNAHVVADLAAKGAIFVQELDEVPVGATVVLAAHGVSPEVRDQAGRREDLAVIDATCPLVAKVHHEARRFVSQGYQIALVGHADHEEVVGTMGEAPDHIHLVEQLADVASLPVGADAPLAYLTQTTLATDETAEIVTALRGRFPEITGPSADDICYATQNRQDAVRTMAHDCDLVLVVGSTNSSNTARLVEVARREGSRAELVEDASQVRLSWLDNVGTVGLTAGASAPDSLVQEVIDTLGLLGPVVVEERSITEESVRFSLPMQVR